MTTLQYTPSEGAEPVTVTLNENESVLDGLLRSGHEVPYGCKAGVCQSCLMQGDTSDIPAGAQKGLKPTQISANQFLACSCVPNKAFNASAIDLSKHKIEAQVLENADLNENIFRLKLQAELTYQPGQFVNLWRDDKIVRSYSLASTPDDIHLEFHLKHIEAGQFSGWAKANLKTGEKLALQGPFGECFYCLEDKNQPILLSGIGTGLAPLYGIVRDALAKGHTGKITMVLGAKTSANFYYIDELMTLVKKHVNLAVIFVALEQDASLTPAPLIYQEGDIYQVIKSRLPSLKGYAVYLCGADSFVKKLKKQCYLQDASLSAIFADAFVAG